MDYAFTSHQGKLIRSVETAEDFKKDTTYDYDGSGRLTRVHKVFRWSEENGGAEVVSETNVIYDRDTIEIESNEGLTRKWMATLDDEGYIAELAFGEGDLPFEEVEQLELKPIEVAYDDDGYLVSSVGHNEYGIHSGITLLKYDSEHRLVGFQETYGDEEEPEPEASETQYRELSYTHIEPVYQYKTTSTTRSFTTEPTTTTTTATTTTSATASTSTTDTTTSEEDEESSES